MKQYEYKITLPRTIEEQLNLEWWLDCLGLQGWKLVQLKGEKYYFIREIEAE